MGRAESHSREVIEADRAEFLQMLRQPVDRGAGTFGEDGYRPPMQAEACLGCGAQIHGPDLPICAVCGMETPWRQEYGRILEFERRHATWRPSDRAAAVRETFGISPPTYELRLARMLSDPRALTVDAVTVRRLIRRRDQMSTARVSEPAARRARPDPRQRQIAYPPRPGNQSPASVLTSTPPQAEGTAESSAIETTAMVDDVAAAGDTFFPTSEGVGRVESDRVWGRRDRLQRLRPLGEHLRILVKRLRDLWLGIC